MNMNAMLTSVRRVAAAVALAALGAVAFSSCQKSDPVQLAAPQPSLNSSTVSSLAFSWNKVENAAKYTYELTLSDASKVESGVTTDTHVEFTGLTDNTTYTFRVAANPADGSDDYLESTVATTTGRTVAIVPLKTPTLNVEIGDESVTVSWDAVENADSYVYSFADSATEGVTSETSATFELEPGKYTITLYATSKNEAYSDSEKASAEFEVKHVAEWKAKGTFEDGGGKIWAAELVAWSDGSYTIKDWYNIKGYNFDFVVNSDGTLSATNGSTDKNGNPCVEAGDGAVSIYTSFYDGYAYSGMEGNKDAGQIWFSSYRTNGDCIFTWPVNPTSMDKVAGTYAQNSSYYFYYNGEWGYYSSTNDVTIAKVDDKTVTIDGLIYEAAYGGKTLTATLDAENGALIINPQQLTEWYTFAGQAETSGVIAKWNNGTWTFGSWELWYDGYYYAYNYSTTLTKK
jgi:hypothetical protein